MSHILKIQRIPGPFASLYEKATMMVINTYFAPLADKVVAYINSGQILDLGTGPGYLPIEIGKREPDLTICGIDLGRKMIRLARNNAAKLKMEQRIRFQSGNAEDLDFYDETFDLVISTGMFHSLRKPVKVLKESYRVLKKGGEIWILDPASVGSQIDIQTYRSSLTKTDKLLFQFFLFFSRVNPSYTYTREELAKMLEKAGCNNYKIEQKHKEIKMIIRK